MYKYVYEADWCKRYNDQNGQPQVDTIDSTYILGWSLDGVARRAKKALLDLYADKARLARELKQNNALAIRIAVRQYRIDTDAQSYAPTLDNLGDFDFEYWGGIERVLYVNRKGEVKCISV